MGESVRVRPGDARSVHRACRGVGQWGGRRHGHAVLRCCRGRRTALGAVTPRLHARSVPWFPAGWEVGQPGRALLGGLPRGVERGGAPRFRGHQAGGAHDRSRGDRPRSELDEAAGRQVSQRTQRVAYVRVSSAGQHLDRQLEAVGTVDKTYREYQSAATASDRPQLREALDYVREGATLVVASIDRLARSLRDMLEIMEELEQKGVTVEFASQGLTIRPD